MQKVSFKERLVAGKTVFGTLVVSESPRWMEVLPGSGLDFVFIDTEHIALGRNTLSWMCQSYTAIGLPPLVRIPSPDPYAATMVLDGGACGVIAPYVESVEQVRSLVGAVKKRPIKGGKLERMLDGSEQETELDAYIEKANRESVLIINVESVDGIEALDDMLKVPGLDGILIGPHDLSCSLGIPEHYDHPQFLEACKTILTRARGAGLSAGIHFWGEPEQQVEFINLGANILVHSADILLFKKYLTKEIKAIRQASGEFDQPEGASPEINI